MKQMHLTDLFEVEFLSQLQSSVSSALGISTGISDENGIALIKHEGGSEFCTKYIKGTEEGLRRCQLCDKRGAELAWENRKPEIYTCHAGLKDIAVPIVMDGRILGSFLGGQVLTEPLPEEKVRAYAKELGIPPEECVEASKKLPILDEKSLKRLADFMYNMGEMFSHMAQKQYKALKVRTAAERESHMKSDFLANMSHEIRTPMNAVIGMAEMALREDLPPAAREYIQQIMASGNTLLAIINDILDFSKIESGKMDINLAEYEPLPIVKDISSIIMHRIGDKNLEFVVDVAPDIPRQLMGDSTRIRQVIINLANNAVKFTREGYVHLSIDYEKKSEREIMLKVAVKDTGIGIKKEDMDKLWHSFQQLDSKRNRNVEGTGLGLAISKQLVALMNGKIWVESEYEKGSCFSFEIPQFIIDEQPSIKIDEEMKKVAGLLCENPYLVENIKRLFEQMQVECVMIKGLENIKLLEEKGAEFLFVESSRYSGIIQEYMAAHPQMTGVVITGYREKIETELENVICIRKPVDIMKMAKILGHEELYGKEEEKNESFEFIAPDAEILIVDDNKPNLMVAEGILAPLQMKIDTAASGTDAIKMIEKKHYDLIFMDHMMPVLDGIETTRIIRRFHEEYDNVPIIALTANVMEETRSMFLVEGMNDFVAKPIELKVIVNKLKQWLPAKKIQRIEGEKEGEEEKQERLGRIAEKIVIPMLDTEAALKLVGSETLFWQILKEYARSIPKKTSLLKQYFEEKNWKNYTIEAHSLKSFSKQVGALELSELAAEMEKAGNNKDLDYIYANHAKLLEKYQAYEPILEKYLDGEQSVDAPKAEYTAEEVRVFLEDMLTAIDNLDMDAMDEAVGQLELIALPKEQEPCFLRLKEAAEGLDVETCEAVVAEWKKIIVS